MDAALKFYEKVEQFPKSSVYPYAVYKKGWCYVNLGDYKTALETFVGVVRMTQEGKVNVNRQQKKALEKEAKKDIVKAYAHVGGPDKAWEFFQRTGGDFAPKMMEALAELYWEQGKFPDSTRVYRKVISMNMDSPAHLRVAEQGRPQHAVLGLEARSGPGDRAPRRRLRQGRRDEGPSRRTRWRSAATPSTTRRRSWRSSGTRRPRRPRTATRTRSTSTSTRSSSTTSRRTRTRTTCPSTTASSCGRSRTGRTRPSSTRRSSRSIRRGSTSRTRPTRPCWPGRTPSTSTTTSSVSSSRTTARR